MKTFITSDPKMYAFANSLLADVGFFYLKKNQHDKAPIASFQGKHKSDMYINIK